MEGNHKRVKQELEWTGVGIIEIGDDIMETRLKIRTCE